MFILLLLQNDTGTKCSFVLSVSGNISLSLEIAVYFDIKIHFIFTREHKKRVVVTQKVVLELCLAGMW